VEDGSVRYLAEENIRPIKPQLQNVQPLMALAGKYFKRFDKENGMFVSNMQAEFPDD
jgi:F-box protein 21